MRRNMLFGIAAVALVTTGLYFLGSADAQSDTTGTTPDQDTTTYPQDTTPTDMDPLPPDERGSPTDRDTTLPPDDRGSGTEPDEGGLGDLDGGELDLDLDAGTLPDIGSGEGGGEGGGGGSEFGPGSPPPSKR
jgi:hypothetical protein